MAGTATGPEFDPRYDPRFQRGWTPSETDGAPAAERVAPVERVVAAETERPAAPTSSGPVSPYAPPDHREAGLEPEPEPEPVDDAPDRADDPSTAFPSPPTPERTPPSSADEAAERDSVRIIRIALGVAWALAGAATLIGFGLVWSFVSSDDPYGISGNEIDELLRTLAQFVAPSLLSTGLLGIVVLIVIDGVRRARRIGMPPSGSGGRTS